MYCKTSPERKLQALRGERNQSALLRAVEFVGPSSIHSSRPAILLSAGRRYFSHGFLTLPHSHRFRSVGFAEAVLPCRSRSSRYAFPQFRAYPASLSDGCAASSASLSDGCAAYSVSLPDACSTSPVCCCSYSAASAARGCSYSAASAAARCCSFLSGMMKMKSRQLMHSANG